MSAFRRLLQALGFIRPTRLVFDLDRELIQSLHQMAEQNQRTPEQAAAALLASALEQHDAARENLARWRSLTPREREVAALTCLGYTNRQIAARLVIAPSTVKTHVRNISEKFGLRRKADLRQALAEWDFSAWDRPP